MLGANGLNVMVNSLGQRTAEIGRIQGIAAYRTPKKVHRHNIIPFTPQKVLELNGLVWTDSPAIAAAGTSGHVMKQFSRLSLVRIIQGACGAILHAGEAPVAVVVYLKERHHRFGRSKSLGIRPPFSQ
jgi:hypothetical protein